MACNTLITDVLSVSKTNPFVNEIITAISTVTNTTGSLQSFYVVFIDGYGNVVNTTVPYTVDTGKSISVPMQLSYGTTGTKTICTDVVCHPPELPPGFKFYQPDNIWNTPIDKLPVHPMSSAYITSMDPAAYVRIMMGFPYNIADNNTPFYTVAFHYPSDIVPYQITIPTLIENAISPETLTESQDGHVFVVNPITNKSYEFYHLRAQHTDGTWDAQTGSVVDLSSYTLPSHGCDAAGMPIMPGIIRYEEIAAGEITHATRVTAVNTQNKFVWNARGSSGQANTSYPPMGQRFRLKASFDISTFPAEAQVILKAWKKYGLIMADNGYNWAVCATRDGRYPSSFYQTMARVHGSDFEAVDATVLMINPTSGQARTQESLGY